MENKTLFLYKGNYSGNNRIEVHILETNRAKFLSIEVLDHNKAYKKGHIAVGCGATDVYCKTQMVLIQLNTAEIR